jgi:hypothetical protein
MIQFYIPWEGEGAMMKNNNPGLVFYQKKILDPFFLSL